MSPNRDMHGERAGPIAFMAGNGVAANLLVIGIVAAGLLSLNSIAFDMYATLPFNQIEVSVPYPGATPEEIEESIVVKVEEQVSSVTDFDVVHSVAAPGMASIRVGLKDGADMDRAMDEVKAAVDRVHSFPQAAERPVFTELTNLRSVLRLIVYGDISERSLKEVAYRIKDELASLPEISRVEATGVRDYEISIEVPLHRLRALGLTLQDIAHAVRRGTLDLSAGSIETREARVRVRTLGQRYNQQDFEDIVVLASVDGAVVRLGDIADVRDDFATTDLIVRHQGKPAAFVEVFRVGDEKVGTVAASVKERLERKVIPSLPAGAGIAIWNDESEFFDASVRILIKNGSLGLLLVFLALVLFLDIRVALWVGVGIAVSAIGTLAVVLALDLTVDSNGLFAFILAIGLVVDDAIVVAEHVHHERRQGVPGLVAAIRGTRRIVTPLIFAVLTSIVAFTPLFFVPGGMGEIFFQVPVILISMLVISLVESVLIMPNHLSHLPDPEWVPTRAIDRLFARTQAYGDRMLNSFVEGSLDRGLRFATAQPVIVLSGAIGLLVVCVSLLPSGIVGTTFVNQIVGDFVTVSLEMPDETPARRTYEVAMEVEAAGRRAIQRLSEGRPEDAPPLLSGSIITVGMGPRMSDVLAPKVNLNPPAHIATVEFKLLGAQQRAVATRTVLEAWRDEVGILPSARSVTFASEIVTLGSPIEVEIAHDDPERLVAIAESVSDGLRQVEGVFDIRSDHALEVTEVQLELRPAARTLGLTVEGMARQVRAAFFGEEALRVQRGRDEVRVYVRLPREERDAITDIEKHLVRTPSGAEVPLRAVAVLNQGRAPLTIHRTDNQRVVTVTADVDTSVVSAGEANDILENTILRNVAAANPGMMYTFGGEAQQQAESLDSLIRSFVLAVLVIFALLAIPLRSYLKPLIIMAVIPLGLVGAIVGHLVIGIAFSFASAMGFVGLSGVVVNDSLIMIDFINQRLAAGDPARTAIIKGAKSRFRPIMLTSVTTFLGFTPLILERAVHAKILVPFAASLGFGVLITSAMLMLVVPALCAVQLHKRVRVEGV